MPLNPNALRHLINNNAIENIYLFSGPEIGEKKEIISLIEKKLFPGAEPVKSTFYCGDDFDIAEVLTALQTRELFSDKKIVYIKNIENIDADSLKKLSEYIIPRTMEESKLEKIIAGAGTDQKKIISKCYTLEKGIYILSKTIKANDRKALVAAFNAAGFKNRDSDTYLIMINETRDRIPQMLQDLLTDKQNVIFWEMFDSQKNEWVREEFKKNNLYIENDALDFMLDMIENNREELKNEIVKIAALFREKPQNENVVRKSFIEEHLYHSKEENAFTLYSVMLEGNLEKALEILETVFFTDEDGLLYGLIWSHRRFTRALDLYENQKMPLVEIYRNLNITVKKNRADFENGFKRYNFRHACMMFHHLGKLDYSLKTLPSNLKLVRLQQFVLDFIMRREVKSFLTGELEHVHF